MIKNVFPKKSALLALALTTLAMTGCEYKDLDEGRFSYDVSRFTISFDWGLVDSIPGEMRVAFYPEGDLDGTRGYTFFDVLNRDTVVELPVGIYNVTAWNRDMDHVITSGYSAQNTVNATTGQYSPHGNYLMPKVLDSLFNGQRVLDYPDYMVHSHYMGFELLKDVNNERLSLRPDSMVVTVDVRLNGIKGLEHCKNIRAAINNVAGRRYMSFDNLTDDVVSVMFDAEAHPADSLVTAKFWVFGIQPSDVKIEEHQIVVFFWLDAGQIYIPINISKAISAFGKDDRYILLESPDLGIDLRDYIFTDSGIQIDVNKWDDVPVDVKF